MAIPSGTKPEPNSQGDGRMTKVVVSVSPDGNDNPNTNDDQNDNG